MNHYGSDHSDLTRADTLQGQQLPWRGSPHDTQGSAMCGGDHAVSATCLSQEGWAVRAGTATQCTSMQLL